MSAPDRAQGAEPARAQGDADAAGARSAAALPGAGAGGALHGAVWAPRMPAAAGGPLGGRGHRDLGDVLRAADEQRGGDGKARLHGAAANA